jgi:DNA modification methylase
LLGEHRLLCGDCTIAEDVARALGKARPHLMVTDAPYGVEYDAEWRNRQMPDTNPGKKGGSRGTVANDHVADWRAAWRHFPGDVAYVWHADGTAGKVIASLEESGFRVRCQIIWAKHQSVIGRGHYHFQHEACLYTVREGGTAHWAGDRKQTTLWPIAKPQTSETGHSTQKPIECMKRPIENNSRAGDAVYEPFSGSGTTIIAAQMTGRRCLAIELDPGYVDVAVQRWELIAGMPAVLEGSGRSFAEVATERAAAANGSPAARARGASGKEKGAPTSRSAPPRPAARNQAAAASAGSSARTLAALK